MASMIRWRRISPLFTGLLLSGACSNQGERIPPADTTASAAASGTVETAGSRVDTTAVVAAQSVPVTPPSSKPRVKPNIDPGRHTPPKPPAVDTPTTESKAPAAGQGQGLKYDAATNTVTFDLIGGPNGFQFNGYASGGATLVLPPKANVVMSFVNKDGTPHSAEIISGEGPLPNAAGDPAIPRAYTNKALEGLPQEGSDVMRFSVPDKGTYRIFCGVPGHGLSGMWIWMKVDPAAKTASFGPTKS
jgi:Sulfocyanin (SoxE) domain